MIGLVDYSLQSSTSVTSLIPNLEIMKLAAYYQKEENQFCRLINLEETELSSYDKIYFFSEDEKQPQIPEAFLRANNVIYGGTAFTGGIYQPFDNSIIDYTLPTKSIYSNFLKNLYSNNNIKNKIITKMLDNTYYRYYAGQNKLPIPPIIPNKQVILYDVDFFYDDWEDLIQYCADKKCSSVIRVHPIVCNKMGQYFQARNTPRLNRANEYILDLNIPYKDINYMLNHYKNLFLADIGETSRVYLPFGSTFVSSSQYANNIVYILNLLFSFWSEKIPIKLKFSEPKIGSVNPFLELSCLIEQWASSPIRKKKSIYEKIPKDKKYNYIRDQYQTILNFYPDAINLFNKNLKDIITGGRWRL